MSSPKKKSINDIAVGATMVLGIALGVGIFFVAPQWIVGHLERWIDSPFWLNMIVGVVKISMFVLYITLISRMKDIRRVFEYHGAEHKVINTYEAKLERVPENFHKFTTIHPRCGTNFLLIVLVTSTLVFTLLGWEQAWYVRAAQRVVLLPVVAGIAYEIIRFAGKYRGSKALQIILAPGLWMQRLTTREPSDDQTEVANCALQAVLDKEREADEKAAISPECETAGTR